jgi:hypothetical protein
MINWKELKESWWELRRPTESRYEWAANLTSPFITHFYAPGLSQLLYRFYFHLFTIRHATISRFNIKSFQNFVTALRVLTNSVIIRCIDIEGATVPCVLLQLLISYLQCF